MKYTDLRLRIRHFFKKYKKVIFIVISIWAIIVFINYLLQNREIEPEATTTYEPHASVMNDSSTTPKKLQEPIEKLIKQYVDYCNERNYQEAYDMLSEECKLYEFENNPANFIDYVLTKMPNEREYAIQDYSNMTTSFGKVYIYEVKYTEDILATGLTGTDFMYTNEKMAFYEDQDGELQFSIGNFIYNTPIQSISENEYLKIDVLKKHVNYSLEEYEVKFTNRSEYIVVILDGKGTNEIGLQLSNEVRDIANVSKLVLYPNESTTQKLIFSKFVDDGDTSQELVFGSIRIMENYSGVENVEETVIQQEIDNAISKFSMTVSVKE